MAAPATGLGHGAEFIGQLDFYAYSAQLRRERANDFTCIRRIAVYVNNERGRCGCIQPDRGPEHLRLAHPIRGDLFLNGNDSADCGMIIVEETRRRCSERCQWQQE